MREGYFGRCAAGRYLWSACAPRVSLSRSNTSKSDDGPVLGPEFLLYPFSQTFGDVAAVAKHLTTHASLPTADFGCDARKHSANNQLVSGKTSTSKRAQATPSGSNVDVWRMTGACGTTCDFGFHIY